MHFIDERRRMTGGQNANSKWLGWWFLCAGSIALLSIFGRLVQNWLVTWLNSYLIAGGILSFALVLLSLLYLQNSKKNVHGGIYILALVLLLASAMAVFLKILSPVETLHFLVFSIFGWVSAATFGAVKGLVAITCVAVSDEVLQYFLPERVGDLHDIMINLVSGGFGVLFRGKNES